MWRLKVAAQPGVTPWREPALSLRNTDILFLLEVALAVVAGATGGRVAAGIPYSECAGRWYAREARQITKSSALALRAALAGGDFAEWLDLKLDCSGDGVRHESLSVWYCPRLPGRAVEPDVYLAADGQPCVLLTPDEAAVLAELFPGLASIDADELLTLDDSRPGMARLSAVPGPLAGRAKDRRVIWWGRVQVYGILFSPILACVGVALGCTLLDAAGIDPTAFGMVTLTLVLAGWAYFQGVLMRPDCDLTMRFLVRYYRGVIVAQALARPDALFAADDPEAIYCEVVPRRAWTNIAAHAHEC